MTKNVKTIDEWREFLDQDAKRRGDFRILTRKMHNSRAFAALSRGGIIVVLAMLDKINYEPKGKKDRRGVKQDARPKNDGKFTITANELKARGLKSSKTIADAKVEAWKLGFFDVIESGSVHHAGVFRLSHRWELYPHEGHEPTDNRRPGVCLYSKFGDKADKILRVENTRKQVVKNTRKDPKALRAESTRKPYQISESPPVENARYYKLPSSTAPETGPKYAVSILNPDVGELEISPAVPAFSAASEFVPGKLSGEGDARLVQHMKRLQRPGRVIEVMEARGLVCERAAQNGRLIRLFFPKDVLIYVHPRKTELVWKRHDGQRTWVFKDNAELPAILDDVLAEMADLPTVSNSSLDKMLDNSGDISPEGLIANGKSQQGS